MVLSTQDKLRIHRFFTIQGMQGVTDRNSQNWLFGVSCMVFTLSSCVSWGSESVSGELGFVSLELPGSQSVSQGTGTGFKCRRHLWGTVVLMRTVGRRGWKTSISLIWPDISFTMLSFFKGEYLVIACLPWKHHATVNYILTA